MELSISTTAFEEGKSFPIVNTCDGDDLSPTLNWDGVPKGTISFALVLDDPDAPNAPPNGSFTHWIVYNIPADLNRLDQIVPIQKNLDNGALQGQNDFGKIGYGGPCPPEGEEHRYFFRLYALDRKLAPEPAYVRSQIDEEIKGHVLAEASYQGVYRRS